jgi:succinyl-CoA synthetase alpha subunit
MSILLDRETRILIQGLSGHQARFDTERALDYGARIVAGVVPGREGEEVFGLPVYNTVAEAVERHRARASVLYVPGAGAKDALLEAAYAGIELAVIITEKIPQRDFAEAYHIARSRGMRIVGPNCNGVISPGKSKMGILGNAPQFFTPGPVGVVSRSGGMNHEICNLLTRAGLGQSTCVSIGGDPMLGSSLKDLLPLFQTDDETRAVVYYGEPGGRVEEEAADFLMEGGFTKPLVAYIAGMFMERMPEGMPFGHAGAIIERGCGQPSRKKKILSEAGARVAGRLAEIPQLVSSLIHPTQGRSK